MSTRNLRNKYAKIQTGKRNLNIAAMTVYRV